MTFRSVIALAFLALCLPAPLRAATAETPPGLTARDFAREPAIQGLAISPSGKNQVGFASPEGDSPRAFQRPWIGDL
ncbi:hypothetical protein [Phenylobacterium sp.]|jgi:hypothetical protein|uniref:hypothetical protein n=1 Tax=Phenylobacterium sp. TaxID=1871053 RepID=UPI0037C4F4A5